MNDLANASDLVKGATGASLSPALDALAQERQRATIGQLLLGEIAEQAFESIYKRTMATNELILEDDRQARTDTDYRVLNGNRRPVFRLNIKFHGSQFRNAASLVGLDPRDCFALATYKIYQGLTKQESERLPYVFVIVGVPGTTGAVVGATVPSDAIQLLCLVQLGKVTGKRGVEEQIVTYLLGRPVTEPFSVTLAGFRREIESANWYVLSARRAANLMKELLFERVYGLRVRGFSMNYRNAELDMHFSLSEDLTPLDEFLTSAKQRGLHGLAVDLERGVL